MDFTTFLTKYPPTMSSEMMVIKEIHKTLENAQHALKDDKKGTEHLKHLSKAYSMLCDYFEIREIDPENYV